MYLFLLGVWLFLRRGAIFQLEVREMPYFVLRELVLLGDVVFLLLSFEVDVTGSDDFLQL